MTSQKQNKSLRFLPFWTLFDYIGDTPSEPFVPVYIVKTYNRQANSPNGKVTYKAADVSIYNPKEELVATNIPFDMLIEKENLSEWAEKISNWFTNYTGEIDEEN